MRWWLTLLALVLIVPALRAQVLIGPNPYFGVGGSISLSRARGTSSLSVSLGGFANRPFGVGPLFPGPLSFGPPGFSRTIIITPPPLVVAFPRPLVVDELARDILPAEFLGRQPDPPRPELLHKDPPPPAEAPLPGQDAGIFRRLDPDNRARANAPVNPQPEPPRRRPEDLRPPAPADNPVDEYARLIKVGKAAFAAQELGRAAERFRQARQLLPREAEAYFLQAQALFALGKYLEAVDTICAGVDLKPDWPLARFRPRDLYGDKAGEYAEHLRRLEQILARNPNDPDLLFLQGYQLWFDGRKDAARQLFRQAVPNALRPDVIQRFLRVADGGLAAR